MLKSNLLKLNIALPEIFRLSMANSQKTSWSWRLEQLQQRWGESPTTPQSSATEVSFISCNNMQVNMFMSNQLHEALGKRAFE